MEKEDAYNKIFSLESEIIQLKALRNIDYNKSPVRQYLDENINIAEVENGKENEGFESIHSFEFSGLKSPTATSPVQDPKIYQKYRDFQNKFLRNS